MAATTLRRVSSEYVPTFPLSTLDTVAFETPASLAMSRMVAIEPPPHGRGRFAVASRYSAAGAGKPARKIAKLEVEEEERRERVILRAKWLLGSLSWTGPVRRKR